MIAYMMNDYYICSSYEELSSLVHDIVHHSKIAHDDNEEHRFDIVKGKLDVNKNQFTSDKGQKIRLSYESHDNIYYKAN